MSFSQAESNSQIFCLAKFFHKLSLETLLTILWWSSYIKMVTTKTICEIKSMVLNNNWSWYSALHYYLSKHNIWEAPMNQNWVAKFWFFAYEIEYKMQKKSHISNHQKSIQLLGMYSNISFFLSMPQPSWCSQKIEIQCWN